MISHRITGASLSRVACTARAALGAGYAALPSGSAATNAVAQRPRRPPCCSHRPVLPSPQGAELSQRRWAHRAAASTPRVAPRPGAKPGGAGSARRPAAAAQSSADSAAAREDGEGDGLGELKARVEALERDHEELGRRGKREAWRLQLIHKRQEAKAARSTSDRPHPHAKQWDHFFDHTARAMILNLGQDFVHVESMSLSAKRTVAEYRAGEARMGSLYHVLQRWRAAQLAGVITPHKMLFGATLEAMWLLRLHAMCVELYVAYRAPLTALPLDAYYAVMESALATSNVDAHFLIIDDLGKVGIPVQRDMLELLFATAMRAGDMTRADQVLDLIQGMGGEMSVRTYRELTIAAVGSGNPARAVDFLQAVRSRSENNPSDKEHLLTLAGSVVRCALDTHDVDSAYAALLLLREEGETIDEGTLHLALKAACARGHVELGELLLEIAQSAGYDVGASFVNSMALLYATAGDIMQALGTVALLEDLGAELDASTRDAVLQCGALNGAMEVASMLEFTHTQGVFQVGRAVCDIVLDILALSGEYETAAGLLHNMATTFGVEPDADLWAYLILCYAHPLKCDHEAAFFVAQELTASGLKLTTKFLDALVLVFLRSREIDQAMQIVARQCNEGTPPSVATFARLAKYHARRNDAKQAQAVLALAQDSGVAVPADVRRYVDSMLGQLGSRVVRLRTSLLERQHSQRGRFQQRRGPAPQRGPTGKPGQAPAGNRVPNANHGRRYEDETL